MKVERGLLSTPNVLKPVMHVIVRLNRVKLFRETIKSHSKFNITIGHQTCTAILSLFKPMDGAVSIDENLERIFKLHANLCKTFKKITPEALLLWIKFPKNHSRVIRDRRIHF